MSDDRKLEEIGFYTLSDERAMRCSRGPLSRCELLITDACNFKCPYCRGCAPQHRGTLSREAGLSVLRAWVDRGLKNVRFSGGEPTLSPHLTTFVEFCRDHRVEHIAVSTNGSAEPYVYAELIEAGVNDFSVSLDACCASTGDAMAGGIPGMWEKVVRNIEFISNYGTVYVTVGVVLTETNEPELLKTVELAHGLGVDDIRIISSAQRNTLPKLEVPEHILAAHPILRYRVHQLRSGRGVRGIGPDDAKRCYLVRDDMAVLNGLHFPCIIYLREGGQPIGRVGPYAMAEREAWFRTHDTHEDPICRKNCLDVCVDHNNRCLKFARENLP